jgi:hypothetical protein
VFDSIPIYTYTTAIVTSEFYTNNAIWNATFNPGGTDLVHLQENGRNFERLNKLECIQRYLDPLASGKDLIVVTSWMTNALTINDSTSLIWAFQNPARGIDWDTESLWICSDYATWPGACTFQNAAIIASSWTVGNFGSDSIRPVPPWSVPVEYCLSGGANVQNLDCGFHWSISIMTLVLVLNVVNITAIWFVARWSQEPSLVS